MEIIAPGGHEGAENGQFSYRFFTHSGIWAFSHPKFAVFTSRLTILFPIFAAAKYLF